MKLLTALTLIAATGVLVAGCSTLPESMYSSPMEIRSASNFELCRAALDPDARRSGTRTGGQLIDEQVLSRGLNQNKCFDVLLSEHGSSTMCSRYQRAVARGEPTALVGFATKLSRQDIEIGLDRNNLSCNVRSVDTQSGLEVLGRQVDKFNDNMSDMYQRRSTTDCYEAYEGTVRCRQY